MKLKLILLFSAFIIIIAGCNKEKEVQKPVSPGFPVIKEWYGAYMNDMLKFNDDGTGMVESFIRKIDASGNFNDSVHHSFKTKWTYNPKAASGQLVIEILHEDGSVWDKITSKTMDNDRLVFTPASAFKFDTSYVPKGAGEKQRKETFALLTAGKWMLILDKGKPPMTMGHERNPNFFHTDGTYEAVNQATWQLLGEEGRRLLTVDKIGNGAILKINDISAKTLKIGYGPGYTFEGVFENQNKK